MSDASLNLIGEIFGVIVVTAIFVIILGVLLRITMWAWRALFRR